MVRQWFANFLVLFVQVSLIVAAKQRFPEEDVAYIILAVGGVSTFCVGLIAASFCKANGGSKSFGALLVLAALTSLFLISFIALLHYWIVFDDKAWPYILAVFLPVGAIAAAAFQVMVSSTVERNRKHFVFKSILITIPFGVGVFAGGSLLLCAKRKE